MRILIQTVLLALVQPLSAHAALHDRGGGLLYDDVQNLTWLQDANYAKTSGYRADGYLGWDDAKTWAATLAYYDNVRGVTLTGWRLPSITPVGAELSDNWAFDGSLDAGPNITRPDSEISYMYYVNLGLKGMWDTAGQTQTDSGILRNGLNAEICGPNAGADLSAGGVTVKNVQNCRYWYSNSYADPVSIPPGQEPWTFYTFAGYQDDSGDMSPSCDYPGLYGCANAWAVREGDVVGAVHEPASSALLLGGLGLLSCAAMRRRAASPYGRRSRSMATMRKRT